MSTKPLRSKIGNLYAEVADLFRSISAVIIFFILWISAITHFGILIGLGLGWLPAFIAAAILGFVIGWLWGIAVLLTIAVTFYLCPGIIGVALMTATLFSVGWIIDRALRSALSH
jgi:hypothetical protein